MTYSLRMSISRPCAVLFVCAGLLLAQEGAPPAKAFRIEDLQCKGVACELREGYQPGLTTIELRGAYRGVDVVRMKVVRRDPKEMVSDRRIAVTPSGTVNMSVPAYRLADGEYVIQLVTVDVPRVLAVGTFRKTTGGALPGPAPAELAAETASTSKILVGKWQGTKRTAGFLVISGDGKYTINGGSGEYHVLGTQITFTGPLSIWNGGHAKLRKDGTLEFAWTNPRGMKRSFAFSRVR